MLTIYARQEPTRDEVLRRYVAESRHRDTVFYRDADCTDLFVVWPWHHSNRPTRRRTVTLNCYKWNIEWVG